MNGNKVLDLSYKSLSNASKDSKDYLINVIKSLTFNFCQYTCCIGLISHGNG